MGSRTTHRLNKTVPMFSSLTIEDSGRFTCWQMSLWRNKIYNFKATEMTSAFLESSWKIQLGSKGKAVSSVSGFWVIVINLGEGPNYSSNSEDCLLTNLGEGPNYSSNSEDCLLINLGEGQIIPLTQKTVYLLLFLFYGISPGLFLLQFFRYQNETSQ